MFIILPFFLKPIFQIDGRISFFLLVIHVRFFVNL